MRFGFNFGFGSGRKGNSGASANYRYVNSVTGNDSNSGRSAANPWATLGKAESALFEGMTLILAGDSVWSERLALGTTNYVTIAWDGVGSRPLIKCDDVIDPAAWTPVPGHAGNYVATLPVQPKELPAEWASIWTDNVRSTLSTVNLSTTDGVDGTYWTATTSEATSIDLYICSATDPRSDGKIREYARRSSGIDAYDSEYSSITGVQVRRPYGSYGGVPLGRYCSANNILVYDGNTHGFFARAFTTLTDVRVLDCYNPTGGTSFIVFEATAPAGATSTMLRCIAEQTTYDGLATSPLGFYNHTAGGTKFLKVTYEDCQVLNLGLGFAAANVETMEIIDPISTGTKVFLKSSADLTTVNGGVVSSVPVSGQLAVFELAGTIYEIDNITATMNTTGAVQSGFANTTFRLTNSTLIGFNTLFSGNQSGQTWYSHDNTFTPNGRQYTAYTLTGASLSLDSDYNDFGEMTGDFVIGATTHANFWEYQIATGQDANSQNEPVTTYPVAALNGRRGAYYDVSDLSTVFADTAMTTPATLNGTVKAIRDKSGSGHHLIASSLGGSVATLKQDGLGNYYVDIPVSADSFWSPKNIVARANLFLAGAVSKGVDNVSVPLFAAGANSGSMIRMVNQNTSRLQGQARRPSGSQATITPDNGVFPVDTPTVVDMVLEAGTLYHQVGATTQLSNSNDFSSGTEVTDWRIGLNYDNTWANYSQPMRFYGGIFVHGSQYNPFSGPASQDRDDVRTWLNGLIT